MKIVTYNINGIRAANKLGLFKWVQEFDADIYCFQEVRCAEDLAKSIVFDGNSQLSLFDEEISSRLTNYHAVFNCGNIAGYAGTFILSKIKPDKVFYDI